jgi:hypothetical protein
MAGTFELRQRPADWQSAKRQISILRYAKQIPARSGERIKVRGASDCLLTAKASSNARQFWMGLAEGLSKSPAPPANCLTERVGWKRAPVDKCAA